MSRLLVMMICLVGLAVPGAAAHEIGKTQATVMIAPDGALHATVVVDPDALLTRLQLLQGDQVRSAASRQERDRAIASYGHAFLAGARIDVDGVPADLSFDYQPAAALSDAVQTPSEVKLTGKIDRAARSFVFTYDFAVGTYALVVHIGDSAAQTFWLEGRRTSAPISIAAPPPPLTSAQVAEKYFGLGFTHIVPRGLDHILFVVGLFLLSTRWRSVLTQVSAFTLAHSITLGLTMCGVVSLPARLVEPLIALSIAYVAIENVVTTELKSWRVALVFSFGLLHGMGFAGVLRDLGMPRGDFLTALLTFNAGVEAGQLAVVAAAFALVFVWQKDAVRYRRLVVQPACVAIALIGMYWTVERLL